MSGLKENIKTRIPAIILHISKTSDLSRWLFTYSCGRWVRWDGR
jgi:hypothetical protein